MAQLFYDTVHTINIQDYTKDQIAQWATGETNLEEWNSTFLEHYTIVALLNKIIVGFGDIDYTGYLDHLYVHKDYQKQGIATAICQKLEDFASDAVTTHASITAVPFFNKRGYKVIKEQQIERGGQLLTNFVMVKLL